MGFYDSIRQNVMSLFGNKSTSKNFINQFNEAFLWAVNGGYTAYEPNGPTYIEQGYNVNPMVYAIVNQMAQKTATVPIYVKKIEDEEAMTKLLRHRLATGAGGTMEQKMREISLEVKAFQEGEKPFPMKRPNATQTWVEFMALYKTFLKTTGNAYIFMLTVDEGLNKGKPMAVYLLPSHMMQIVLKSQTALLGIEDPVDGYILVQGRSYLNFKNEDVIHIKYANPNYGQNGEHLYGQSPLRAALRNIESSNLAMNLNIKTLKSGGAFGFIHGKGPSGITPTQAAEMKERLVEMNQSPENLSKIAAVSADLGFQRISLTSEELKPFDYLRFDQKQIANVLAWSDTLLNNDDGGKYDKQKEEKKRVIIDNIVPDLNLLINALNEEFLPRFKGYEGCRLEFDVMELPEMQEDAGQLSQWLYSGLDKGLFTRNEVRKALRWTETKDASMDVFTVTSDIITLDEAIDNDFNTGKDEPKV